MEDSVNKREKSHGLPLESSRFSWISEH